MAFSVQAIAANENQTIPCDDDSLSVSDNAEHYISINDDQVSNSNASSSEVEINVDDIYANEDETIQVLVKPSDASGNVTLTLDGKSYTLMLKNAEVQKKFSNLNVGLHNVIVKYNGDDNYMESQNSASFTVKKLKAELDIITEVITEIEDEIVIAYLPSDSTGYVTCYVDGREYTSRVIGGTAFFKIKNLKAGKYSIYATYSGDDKYFPTISTTSEFNVLKIVNDINIIAPDITVGDDAIITVTLPKDATGNVTIKIDGKEYTSPVKNGEAKFVVPNLKVGKYNITAYYSGDDMYYHANATGEIQVLEKQHHQAIGLEKYPTANPIFVLLLCLLTIGLCPIIRK